MKTKVAVNDTGRQGERDWPEFGFVRYTGKTVEAKGCVSDTAQEDKVREIGPVSGAYTGKGVDTDKTAEVKGYGYCTHTARRESVMKQRYAGAEKSVEALSVKGIRKANGDSK